MQWTVHGERVIYDSQWVRLSLADVEVPGGSRFDHHVIRAPRGAAGVVVTNDDSEVLMLWRHRFITDSWGWEIPAGAVDGVESVETAARREVLEETGWEIEALTPLVDYHPMNGISDQVFSLFHAHGAEYRHPPTDASESERVEWVPFETVRRAVAAGEVRDGLSLTALAFAMATAVLPVGLTVN
jgi:8-oxo-dGTP pyrophosphatase MutT (NUDIX family)